MKENCDWKKCLDRIEDKGFDDDDAYSEILEYIREVEKVWNLCTQSVSQLLKA